jgi:hypothetical protein
LPAVRLDRFDYVGGQRRSELHPLTAGRMMEGQPRGVQTQTNCGLQIADFGLVPDPKGRVFGFAIRNSRFAIPVHFITDDWMADVGAVYPKLVRAAGDGL